MATHSSTLAWKISRMEEPGRLQSLGLLLVGHDWAALLSLFTFMHWRRKWQPTPVFLPGESQGWRSLVGSHLWGHTELDMTEATQRQQQNLTICKAFLKVLWRYLKNSSTQSVIPSFLNFDKTKLWGLRSHWYPFLLGVLNQLNQATGVRWRIGLSAWLE